jgi:hypothetical protein
LSEMVSGGEGNDATLVIDSEMGTELPVETKPAPEPVDDESETDPNKFTAKYQEIDGELYFERKDPETGEIELVALTDVLDGEFKEAWIAAREEGADEYLVRDPDHDKPDEDLIAFVKMTRQTLEDGSVEISSETVYEPAEEDEAEGEDEDADDAIPAEDLYLHDYDDTEVPASLGMPEPVMPVAAETTEQLWWEPLQPAMVTEPPVVLVAALEPAGPVSLTDFMEQTSFELPDLTEPAPVTPVAVVSAAEVKPPAPMTVVEAGQPIFSEPVASEAEPVAVAKSTEPAPSVAQPELWTAPAVMKPAPPTETPRPVSAALEVSPVPAVVFTEAKAPAEPDAPDSPGGGLAVPEVSVQAEARPVTEVASTAESVKEITVDTPTVHLEATSPDVVDTDHEVQDIVAEAPVVTAVVVAPGQSVQIRAVEAQTELAPAAELTVDASPAQAEPAQESENIVDQILFSAPERLVPETPAAEVRDDEAPVDETPVDAASIQVQPAARQPVVIPVAETKNVTVMEAAPDDRRAEDPKAVVAAPQQQQQAQPVQTITIEPIQAPAMEPVATAEVAVDVMPVQAEPTQVSENIVDQILFFASETPAPPARNDEAQAATEIPAEMTAPEVRGAIGEKTPAENVVTDSPALEEAPAVTTTQAPIAVSVATRKPIAEGFIEDMVAVKPEETDAAQVVAVPLQQRRTPPIGAGSAVATQADDDDSLVIEVGQTTERRQRRARRHATRTAKV